MRKRFSLFWMLVVLGAALALPASTAAASPGKFGFIGGYCSGTNTVNATFKLVKNSGYYASDLGITAKGQAYINGAWKTEVELGTATKAVDTNGSATLKKTFTYNPGHAGRHRILATGKIWNGNSLVASGRDRSGYCS
jgi:hypothetical protein